MRSRPALLALAWLGVTLGLTAVAWLAVRVVANQVGGSDTTVLTEAEVDGLLLAAPSATPTSSASAPTPSASTKPSSSPKPSKTPTPSGSANPTGSPKPSSSSNPGSPASTKSFATSGGVVSATCHGSTISLGSARPADGWTVEVKDRGPQRVEVRFENDAGDRTEVRVSCVRGDPIRDSSGSDDDSSGPG